MMRTYTFWMTDHARVEVRGLSYRAAKRRAYEVWPGSIVLLSAVDYKGGIDILDTGYATVYINAESAIWWAIKRWLDRR